MGRAVRRGEALAVAGPVAGASATRELMLDCAAADRLPEGNRTAAVAKAMEVLRSQIG